MRYNEQFMILNIYEHRLHNYGSRIEHIKKSSVKTGLRIENIGKSSAKKQG